MEKMTGVLADVMEPKSWARPKTGQLLDTALKLVSAVFGRRPLLTNCARTVASLPLCHVAEAVWKTKSEMLG